MKEKLIFTSSTATFFDMIANLKDHISAIIDFKKIYLIYVFFNLRQNHSSSLLIKNKYYF
jgi:hypothetical protein